AARVVYLAHHPMVAASLRWCRPLLELPRRSKPGFVHLQRREDMLLNKFVQWLTAQILDQVAEEDEVQITVDEPGSRLSHEFQLADAFARLGTTVLVIGHGVVRFQTARV